MAHFLRGNFFMNFVVWQPESLFPEILAHLNVLLLLE